MRNGRSTSSKIVDFGTNRKRVRDLLLVINSNLGLILHHFWDMATYWPKNHTLVLTLSLGVSHLNFWMNLTLPRLLVIELSVGKILWLSSFWHSASVWQTDGYPVKISKVIIRVVGQFVLWAIRVICVICRPDHSYHSFECACLHHV